MNETWNNPAPEPRKGMPTWAKVLLGCGIVAVLAVAGCTALVAWGCSKGMTYIQDQLREPYQVLVKELGAATTAEGMAAMYKAHPELARKFASEAAFTEELKRIQEKVGPLPETLPDMFSLLKEERLKMDVKNHNGVQTYNLKYRNPGKSWLVIIWEGKTLVDLRIEE